MSNDLLVPGNEVEALLRTPAAVSVAADVRARHVAMLAAAVVEEPTDADVESRAGQRLSTAGSGQRRRRVLVASIAAGALVAVGGGLAVAGLTRTPPTQPDELRCFGLVTSEYDDEYLFVGVRYADPAGGDDATTADVALELCAQQWARGTLTGGEPPVDFTVPPDAPATNPVPPLQACVLPGGGVGVYPGEPGVCAALGFPEADLGSDP